MNKINGRYLRKLREAHGYSIREFAELVYSSKSSVQRWENSFAPNDEELLQKIASVYSITVEQMQKESEEQFGKKKPRYTADELAELKYGTKLLPIAITLMVILGIGSIAGIIIIFLIAQVI